MWWQGFSEMPGVTSQEALDHPKTVSALRDIETREQKTRPPPGACQAKRDLVAAGGLGENRDDTDGIFRA